MAVLLLGAPALAAPPLDPFQEHRAQARALYLAGRFEESLEELRAAYAIRPEPRLLLNMGHACLELGRPEQALRYYERYRERAPSLTSVERDDLEGYVRRARARLAASGAASGAPSQPEAPASAAPDPRPAAAPPAPAPAPPTTAAAPAPALSPATAVGARPASRPASGAPAPLYRRPWLWGVVSAAAAAVVVGVAVGVARRPRDPLPEDIRDLEGKFALRIIF